MLYIRSVVNAHVKEKPTFPDRGCCAEVTRSEQLELRPYEEFDAPCGEVRKESVAAFRHNTEFFSVPLGRSIILPLSPSISSIAAT